MIDSNVFVKDILRKQEIKREQAERDCEHTYGESLLKNKFSSYNESTKNFTCPPYWDEILCWPSTPSNSTASLPCPTYITGFSGASNATLKCMENGHWYQNEDNQTWTNYTTCSSSGHNTLVFVNFDRDYNDTSQPGINELSLELVTTISRTGYLVSITTLILAFFIMLSIRKLHCSRNILHMHLFASFILKALMFLIKQGFFQEGIGLAENIIQRNNSLYYGYDTNTKNWLCKFVMSLLQYSVTASYSWILMEGFYLHNLIFHALFADSSKSIRWYIIMGWSLPFVAISVWVAARIFMEDTYCWTGVESMVVMLIGIGPIMLSVGINFVIFLRISLLLFNKLRSPLNDHSQRYQKWIKSTLVLVPLFGVHYVLSLALFFPLKSSAVGQLAWLIWDQLLGSFQGFFVAILYCFLNGEVKTEILPYISSSLRFLAMNKYTKHFFPCRQKFLRSVVGRSSVCTTMSCSSLYTNGVLHRNSKSRLDLHPKPKQGDKANNHFCQNNGLKKNPRFIHRHSQPLNMDKNVAETALCLNKQYQSEPDVNEEDSFRMINMKSEF